MRRGVWKPGAALVMSALALTACASLRPKPPPPEPALAETPAEPAAAAKTPAPIIHIIPPPPKVSCVPKTLPHAPKYPDTDGALKDAGGAADRYQLMAAGRLLRMRRLAELEKAIDACR